VQNENGKYFQTSQKVLEEELITSKERDQKIRYYSSQEFFTFILLDKTMLTLEQFQKEQMLLVHRNDKHDLVKSSCSHAAYRGLTRKDHGPNLSTQRGIIRAVFEIIPPDDLELRDNFEHAFQKSGMRKDGYERGEEYLNIPNPFKH
jgi:hypothetical protein